MCVGVVDNIVAVHITTAEHPDRAPGMPRRGARKFDLYLVLWRRAEVLYRAVALGAAGRTGNTGDCAQ